MIRAGLILIITALLVLDSAVQAQTTTAPVTGNANVPSTAPATAAAPEPTQQYRQAYREGFQPPEDTSDEMVRMRELIDKINRTSLPDYRPVPVTQKARITPKVVTPPVTAPKAEAKPKETTPDELSTQTLQTLAQRVPESVADPVRLGDALYRSGHIEQALFIYRQALAEVQDPDDQLWLNYQIGCCLKDTQPAEAKKLFQQVRTAAPDSPWAELANIQLQLVDWMERNQPTQFLDDLRRDQTIQDERIDETRQAQPRTGETSPSKEVTGSGTMGTPNASAEPQPAASNRQPAAGPVETEENSEPKTLSQAD